jgi:hypothetical protein
MMTNRWLAGAAVVSLTIVSCSSGKRSVEEPDLDQSVTKGCWAEQACERSTDVCLTPGSPPCDKDHGCTLSMFPRATCGPAKCPEGQICTDSSACLEAGASCIDDDDCSSRDERCYYKPGGSGICVRRSCQVSDECETYCVEGWCFDEPGFCSDATVL